MIPKEMEDIFLLYAAGSADAEEVAQVEALLASGNPAAQASYAEAVAVVNSIPLALDRVEAPKAVRDRLLSRIAMDHAGDRVSSRAPARGLPMWPTYIALALAACLAIALTASLVLNHRLQQRRHDLAIKMSKTDAALVSSRSALKNTQNRLKGAMAVLADARSVMSGPDVALASMKTTGEGAAFGRVLYCPQTRQYQVMVFNLQAPPPGKVYELWLITPDQRKIPAGTFDVDAKGAATLMAYAPEGTDIHLAAVTDEPMGGVKIPTGTIQLAGELQK